MHALSVVAASAHAALTGADPTTPVLPVAWCRFGLRLLHPLGLDTAFSTWQLDPVALGLVVLLAVAYLRLAARAAGGERWPRVRTGSFLAGLVVVAVATNSAVAAYDMTLFSAHMVQHLLLIMVAPPLLVAGRPLSLLAAGGPAQAARVRRVTHARVVQAITAPPVALACYAGVIVATHLTGLMDTIMTRPWLGQVEHLVYLLVGVQFFSLVFGEEPIRWKLSAPGRMLLVAMSMAVDTFVGVVLLQTTHALTMLPHPGWGPSPLSDTRTGGALMWVGGDGLMAVLLIVMFTAWARRPASETLGRDGWLEQARLANFRAQTAAPGAVAVDGPDLDDDEAAHVAYNAYLARLARSQR